MTTTPATRLAEVDGHLVEVAEPFQLGGVDGFIGVKRLGRSFYGETPRKRHRTFNCPTSAVAAVALKQLKEVVKEDEQLERSLQQVTCIRRLAPSQAPCCACCCWPAATPLCSSLLLTMQPPARSLPVQPPALGAVAARCLAVPRRRQVGVSGYKGVTYDKQTGKFIACIFIDGRKVYLGTSESAQEMAQLYSQARLQMAATPREAAKGPPPRKSRAGRLEKVAALPTRTSLLAAALGTLEP